LECNDLFENTEEDQKKRKFSRLINKSESMDEAMNYISDRSTIS